MFRRVCSWLAVVVGLVALLALGSSAYASFVLWRDYSALPLPPIAADTSRAGVARGELLFQSLCMECHGGADQRASGKALTEVPSFLGRFYSANLAHPEHGVHARSDGELARVLRTGVLPDGRFSLIMNGFSRLGDADVAALIGYMRSGAPTFAPSAVEQPQSQPSLAAALIVAYVARMRVDAPGTGIAVPPKAATVEYGRYMASALDCVGCHSAGFASNKAHEPGAFAGGFALVDEQGGEIYTKNITFHRTGLAGWSVDDFQRALTTGVRPDGYLVRRPMPLFSRLDRTDIAALYAFLQQVPQVERANTPSAHAPVKAQPADGADVLFVQLGCVGCHGDAGPHRQAIQAARDKSDAQIADWILDPQAIKPGAAMPSFQGAIDRSQAERLAKYVRQLASDRS